MTHQTTQPLSTDRGFRLPLTLCILALLVSVVACAPGSDRTAAADEARNDRPEAIITTAGDHIDDAILHFEAKARLLDKLGWAAIGIDVDSMDGRIVLTGEVPVRADRELAEEIAYSVEGVERVENRLALEGESIAGAPAAARVATRVAPRMAEAELEVRDALLEARLKARLLEEIGRNALDIEVEAADGVVTLRGELDNEAHEQIALEAASRTEGVKRVINLLRA